MSDKQRDAWAFRRVMWQRLDTPGTEICSLTSSTAGAQNGHLLITQVQVALNGIPRPYRCMVQCDAAWRTSEAWAMSTPGESVRLRVEDGCWLVSGREWRSGALDLSEQPDLAGCVDVDLGISPSTNTLPIRRLNLAIGESRELTAAWVRFPELTVESLAQRYTRLAERRYRYESIVSGFTAELEVDDLGLVIDYEGIWRRVAESGA